jgi:hypothetical protein
MNIRIEKFNTSTPPYCFVVHSLESLITSFTIYFTCGVLQFSCPCCVVTSQLSTQPFAQQQFRSSEALNTVPIALAARNSVIIWIKRPFYIWPCIAPHKPEFPASVIVIAAPKRGRPKWGQWFQHFWDVLSASDRQWPWFFGGGLRHDFSNCGSKHLKGSRPILRREE